jgi:hypothetical protein
MVPGTVARVGAPGVTKDGPVPAMIDRPPSNAASGAASAHRREPAMPQVIGELVFRQGGRPMTAQLVTGLTWQCDDKQLEQLLNEACPVDDAAGEVHQPVVHSLYQAGERLGAEVHILQRQPA